MPPPPAVPRLHLFVYARDWVADRSSEAIVDRGKQCYDGRGRPVDVHPPVRDGLTPNGWWVWPCTAIERQWTYPYRVNALGFDTVESYVCGPPRDRSGGVPPSPGDEEIRLQAINTETSYRAPNPYLRDEPRWPTFPWNPIAVQRTCWGAFPRLREDRIECTITPDTKLGPNRVSVSLSTAPSITWWKELKRFGPTPSVVEGASLWTEDDRHDAGAMVFSSQELIDNYLVFSKKVGLFAVPTGMYWLRFRKADLDTLRQRAIRFHWTED